jgi:ABC-2 type transport system ATP-binding protein
MSSPPILLGAEGAVNPARPGFVMILRCKLGRVTAVIRITGLVKTFGRGRTRTRALDGLDLTVAEGEVHGFLGPNGAGKSTTLRVLLSLLMPDAGDVRLFGEDARRTAVAAHRRLAYVPGDVALWPDLSGGQVLDLLDRMRGVRSDPARRAELLDRFDLDPGKKGRAYSKGNRQKVMLVAALSADVELLVLDEPTSGLDPVMEAEFRACLLEERAKGRTILLSSHVLGEVEAVCDRVSIVRAGRIAEAGTLAELRHLTRTSINAELARVPAGLADLAGLHDIDVVEIGGGEDATAGGVRLSCSVDSDRLGELVAVLGSAGVRTLTSQAPTLEELFLRHYVADAAL